VPFSIGLTFTHLDLDDKLLIWVLFTIPLALGLLQILLLLTAFNYDTPVVLKQR
jgi:hypothetical protein